MSKFVIDTLDYRGKRVIFTHKKWEQKCKVHPELRKIAFLNNLKQTIEEPEMVFQNKKDRKNQRCYYKKYSIDTYVKIIVWTKFNPCCIVSAFETDYIKEENYPELKQLL